MVKVCWLLPSFLSILLLGPARASKVENWHFDVNSNQLNFTTDEDVQPKVQLIANPTRLVIDLPGIILGHPQTTRKVGAIVQEIRIGQFNPKTTRLVIALSPGYTLDPVQVRVRGESPTRWVVQLPTPQRLTGSSHKLIPSSQKISVIQPKVTSAIAPGSTFAGVMPLGTQMMDLQAQVKALMDRYKFLKTGMFFLDLDTGNYLNIGGDHVFSAASTIKLPILIAFFQHLDEGKVDLNQTLVMRRDLITGGSGVMQYRRVGTKFSVKETVTKMITISDNTATNMIIDRLGGIKKLNQRFRSWGLKDTIMRHLLADLRGTNTTSSQDLVRLLALLSNDKVLSASSRGQALDILRHVKTKTLLPAGLGKGAVIAHKTGDIGFLIGDAGLIVMPNGKRYLAGIFVKRPYNDTRGRDFIRQVSRLVYNYLDQPNVISSAAPTSTPQLTH